MPFGEELYPDGNHRTTNLKYSYGDNVRQKFTGYQKDEETGLDFAEARMYQNLHGRFTAVDPLLASGKNANPQTFNRYVYVINNPLIFTDPTGLQVGNHTGQVYTAKVQGVRMYYAKGGNGRRKYDGPRKSVLGRDGYRYTVWKTGWIQGPKVANAVRSVVSEPATTGSGSSAAPRGLNQAPVNDALLQEMIHRGPALNNIARGLTALMLFPAALPIVPHATSGAAAAAGAHGSLSAPTAAAVDFTIGFTAGVAGERLVNGSSDNQSNDNPTIQLFRGVSAGHPGFDDALNGTAIPLGWPNGHTNPIAHNAGNTNSVFTSWTEDYSYALDLAGPGGVILFGNIPITQTVPSPGLYDDIRPEYEVLVVGPVYNAVPIRVP